MYETMKNMNGYFTLDIFLKKILTLIDLNVAK